MSDYSTPASKILIATVVLLSILGGFVHFIQGMNTQYGSELPIDQLNSTFSRFGGLQRNVTVLENETTEGITRSETTTLAGLIIEGLQGMWNTLKISLGAIPEIIVDTQEVLGLPAWFVNLVTVIITIVLIAAIVKVVLGREL
jgi:uncharacterized membrane protein